MPLAATARSMSFELATDEQDKRLPKVVVLGTGWAAFRMVKSIDSTRHRVVVISPRNHFLFTPLLPATASGTLEFRSIIEPIRSSKIMRRTKYYQALATRICPESKTITCHGTLTDEEFEVDYDKLVIAVGARNNTFNIEGVHENAHFLKELSDARAVRTKVIQCFEEASLPSTPAEERQRLLNTVIVGGGPTGIEFAGELSDLYWQDLRKSFPDVPPNEVKMTVLEASHGILSAFHGNLVKRALANLRKRAVDVRTDTVVQKVHADHVELKDGQKVPYGTLIWSTGVAARDVVDACPLTKEKGRIVVDEFLRARGVRDVYALGDCAAIEGNVLPPTAQVAQQQGKYLAEALNCEAKGKELHPFKYHFLGLMTYVGNFNSLIDTPQFKASGFWTWIAWRSAYLTRLGTVKNKLQVPFDWMRTILFGRDVTSF